MAQDPNPAVPANAEQPVPTTGSEATVVSPDAAATTADPTMSNAAMDPGMVMDPAALGGADVAPLIDPLSPEALLASNDSIALTKMGFSHLIAAADIVGLVVLIVMAVMSVLTWYYIFYNSFRIMAVNRRARRVMEDFWNAASPQEATEQLRAQPDYEPFSKVALEASDAAAHYGEQSGGRMSEVLSRPEFIARRLQHTLKKEAGVFDTGLTLLATVGSTAPFVGLFGTVWGIYHALIGIGIAGKATLDVVAGPVGEALIMTCIGLGVAIPAVLMYNFFVRANKGISERLYTFGNDLLDYFATGSRVRTQRYGNRQQSQTSST
jgi:biopolymer transport protein ExbB